MEKTNEQKPETSEKDIDPAEWIQELRNIIKEFPEIINMINLLRKTKNREERKMIVLNAFLN